MKNRREFLQVLSSAMLAPMVLGQTKVDGSKASKIPLAFSTLGCPGWEWNKILEFATQHGFSAIELRGLEGKLDLAAPHVRGFGGQADSNKSLMPNEETKARVAAGLRELGKYAGPHNVTVIIESHDHFTASSTLKSVLQQADSEHVGLLWDAHHTFATSNEDPESTVRQLGSWIRHTHLKDSTGSGEDRKYVLTGRGNVPIQRQIEALRSIGYKGFYCFEWEKLWHPDIEDPEIAIADFARVVGQC